MRPFVAAIVLLSAAGFMIGGASSRAEAAPKRSPAAVAAAGGVLRKAFESELGRMGSLAPWQKRVLEEEVLSQPQSYVLQEKTEADGTSKFDFDVETVKRILALGCGEVAARCGAEVLVRVAAPCAKCVEKVAAVQRIAETHLSRRGFKPVQISPTSLSADLVRARSGESGAEDSVEPSEWESERHWQQAMALRAARLGSAGTSGSGAGRGSEKLPSRALLLVSLQELQDASHPSPDGAAEEPGRPALRVAFAYRERSGAVVEGPEEWNWAVARWAGVHANDALGAPLGRLFGDVVTELVVSLGLGSGGGLGEKNGSGVLKPSEAPEQLGGFTVRILGVRSFQQYTRAKNVLSAALQSAGFAEPFEQALKRGEVLWRVLPEKTGAASSALLLALRGARPGDPGLGEKPLLRILDPSVSADRDRIELLEDSDDPHPLFREATVTVELPGEERKR